MRAQNATLHAASEERVANRTTTNAMRITTSTAMTPPNNVPTTKNVKTATNSDVTTNKSNDDDADVPTPKPPTSAKRKRHPKLHAVSQHMPLLIGPIATTDAERASFVFDATQRQRPVRAAPTPPTKAPTPYPAPPPHVYTFEDDDEEVGPAVGSTSHTTTVSHRYALRIVARAGRAVAQCAGVARQRRLPVARPTAVSPNCAAGAPPVAVTEPNE